MRTALRHLHLFEDRALQEHRREHGKDPRKPVVILSLHQGANARAWIQSLWSAEVANATVGQPWPQARAVTLDRLLAHLRGPDCADQVEALLLDVIKVASVDAQHEGSTVVIEVYRSGGEHVVLAS